MMFCEGLKYGILLTYFPFGSTLPKQEEISVRINKILVAEFVSVKTSYWLVSSERVHRKV